MGFKKFLAGLGVESQTLEKTYDEADAVWTGEFEVGGRREFWIDFNDLLEKDGDCSNWVPEQNGQFWVGFSFPAEQIEGLSC